jgi:hypothetical protein
MSTSDSINHGHYEDEDETLLGSDFATATVTPACANASNRREILFVSSLILITHGLFLHGQ